MGPYPVNLETHIVREFGLRLDLARRAKGLTLGEVARLGGISIDSVSPIIAGSVRCQTGTAFRISKALDVPLAFLCDYKSGASAYPAEVERHVAEGMQPLRVLRHHAGMTLSELQRCSGIPYSELRGIEVGGHLASLWRIVVLAAIFNVRIDPLVADLIQYQERRRSHPSARRRARSPTRRVSPARAGQC